MLFKEKLYLSNCDSVRQLSDEEVRKRFLIGAVFAQGVILSPNLLIDNSSMVSILRQANVSGYFREEGAGNIVVRGFGVSKTCSLVEYFDALPDFFRVSRFGGKPKSRLMSEEKDAIRRDLDAAQSLLEGYEATFEPVSLGPDALTDAILQRQSSEWRTLYFGESDLAFSRFLDAARTLQSRSAWYDHIESMPDWSEGKKLAFRLEVVDSAYNALFVAPGEAFAMDRVGVLGQVPSTILDQGVSLRAMRRKLELVAYPLRAFQFISSMATNELAQFLLDEALDYAESRFLKRGWSWATKKNWFGLYPKMTDYIGVELKR